MTNGDNFRKNLRLQLYDNPYFIGLDTFQRHLEKEYFAKVTARNCTTPAKSLQGTNEQVAQLAIEMECNLDLVEILYYLQKGNWGVPAIPTRGKTPASAFYEALNGFRESNPFDIDVEELSLILKDTVIVIRRIFPQSIGEEFGQILQALAAHYVHFTRDLTETPYEIYLPVFEEEVPNGNALICPIKRDQNTARDYYRYWALYFDSTEDARIYDLDQKTIISGDLHMLNQ